MTEARWTLMDCFGLWARAIPVFILGTLIGALAAIRYVLLMALDIVGDPFRASYRLLMPKPGTSVPARPREWLRYPEVQFIRIWTGAPFRLIYRTIMSQVAFTEALRQIVVKSFGQAAAATSELFAPTTRPIKARWTAMTSWMAAHPNAAKWRVIGVVGALVTIVSSAITFGSANWLPFSIGWGVLAGAVAGLNLCHHYRLRIGGLTFNWISGRMLFALGAALVLIPLRAWYGDDPIHVAWHELSKETGAGEIAGLLLGYAVFSLALERSRALEKLAAMFPAGDQGLFWLLVGLGAQSWCFDNALIALILGTFFAMVLGGGKNVSVALALGCVALANAFGAASPFGDITTIMAFLFYNDPAIALHGIPAVLVYIAIALPWIVIGQQRFCLYQRPNWSDITVHWGYLLWAVTILTAILYMGLQGHSFLWALWGTIGVGYLVRSIGHLLRHGPSRNAIPWPRSDEHRGQLASAFESALFILFIMEAASLVVLPNVPRGPLTLYVGAQVSSVYDNIPLMAQGLSLGGFDVCLMALLFGMGGTGLPNGSAAGVAIGQKLHDQVSPGPWLRASLPHQVALLLSTLFYVFITGYEVTPPPLK